MDFMEETLLDLLFLGEPRERPLHMAWYSALKRVLFTNFWLTNSVTSFQFNLLGYCFTLGLSLVFCSQILKKAVRKIQVILCPKSFRFCYWTSKKFKIVRKMAAYVRASISWLIHFKLIALMLGGRGNQNRYPGSSSPRSNLHSEKSSKTKKHSCRSTAPVSPNMKPTQLRRALHQILFKGKIQRPLSGKDRRSDKYRSKDTTDLRKLKRQTRQNTMPIVIDKFKGVMCLVPDHFEDQLTFSQGDKLGVTRSRVRKVAVRRGKAVQRREITECSEMEGNSVSSKLGNETSVTSITVEEATTDLMSGNMKVIRHKYFAQTETSSTEVVQSGSFIKVSQESSQFSRAAGNTTVSTSEQEMNHRPRTNPRSRYENGSAPRYGINSLTPQPSVQCCPGLHDIPIVLDVLKRRRQKKAGLDLCKENDRHYVEGVWDPKALTTPKTKTMKATGQHLISGENYSYVREGGKAAVEKHKICAKSGLCEKKIGTRAKSSASDSVSTAAVIAEIALSKSSQEVYARSLSTPSHFDFENSHYHDKTVSMPSKKSRMKLEHLNISGFHDTLKSSERDKQGVVVNLTNEATKPSNTTLRSENEYPRWGSATMSDKVRKKAIYGAPEAKPPPGKPSPRKTLQEKELSDKILTDFKLCDKKLRSSLTAENTYFSKCSRKKLRSMEAIADFKGMSLYPTTQFMSVFGKKNLSEDSISSEKKQTAKVITGLKFDFTSLMTPTDRFPGLADEPKVISNSDAKSDITTKSHFVNVGANPAHATSQNLTIEQGMDQLNLKENQLSKDSKVVQFNVLDTARRVSEANQILKDTESFILTTADDTKCFTEPPYTFPDEYESRGVRRQQVTGAIRNKIGAQKYQPYVNPRLAKNETLFSHHKWFSSTALTQSSSSMKETKSSNETKDTLVEQRQGGAKNQTPLKSSMSKGDYVTMERKKRMTKQHPRFLLSRPRIGPNINASFEPKGPGSSTDDKDLTSAKKLNAKMDRNVDDNSRVMFPRTYSTDSSSDRDHAAERLKKFEKSPFFKHNRSLFSTTNIHMIEALSEENFEQYSRRAHSSCDAGARKARRKGELKGASDFSKKDLGQTHHKTEQQRDPASVIGSNSTQSGSKQTSASKKLSDDRMSSASKKSGKDTVRDNKAESKKVEPKSETTRPVVSETVTSPRLNKEDGFKLRVTKTEGDLLEARKRHDRKLNNGGVKDTRHVDEKTNTLAGLTILRRICKILSRDCDEVKQNTQEINSKIKVSRIPIYVGASLIQSFSAVNNKRDAQKATRSLTNTAHPPTAAREEAIRLRQGQLKGAEDIPPAKDAIASTQNACRSAEKKSSPHRLDKKRAVEAIKDAKLDPSDAKFCRHIGESKSSFSKLTLKGANEELKAVLPMLIDHSKDSIIIITPDTKIKHLTNIIDKVGQFDPGVLASGTGALNVDRGLKNNVDPKVKRHGYVDVCHADGRKEVKDTFTGHETRHQRLAVQGVKSREIKHYLSRDGVYDEDVPMVGSSFSGSVLLDEDVHTHIANKRLRHICSPEACRLCGTHTQDNTTCEMGKVDQMTSHQQYTMNTQKLLFRRTLTRQDNVKSRYDSEDAATDQKDGQINQYFIMHDAYRVIKRRKSPVTTKQDSTVSSFNDKHLQLDEDRVSSMNSRQSSSLKTRKQPLHQRTKLTINYEDLIESGKGKKKKKKSNASVKSSESRTVKSVGVHSPTATKTETLLPDDLKNDDDESDVIQVVTYEDYHCRSESTTAPLGESPRIMSSPVPGYQRNTRSYNMKIAMEDSQKAGSGPVHSDYIIDPEVQQYRLSRIHKRKNPKTITESACKPTRDNIPKRQFSQDRQSKFRRIALQTKTTYLPSNQIKKKFIRSKANLPSRFEEDEKNGSKAPGELNKKPEMNTKLRDGYGKVEQGMLNDRKHGEILHNARKISWASTNMKPGEAAKLSCREAKIKQVSIMGYKVTDGAFDKSRKVIENTVNSTARKAAGVTMDVASRKMHEPAAPTKGQRAPHIQTDNTIDGSTEKNDSDSIRLKPFYLKRNFAKLKNPFTTITRQNANMRVLDALETKHIIRYEPKPYSEEPKPRQRLDYSTKDPVTRFQKGSVDKQTDSLLKGSTTGTANFERVTCIPTTVRVKQTKTSLQRQRSSHLHHDFSQYMTFAWQADDKVTEHREEKNPFTSSKVEEKAGSFDHDHVLESSTDRSDPNLDENDATHTLPRETSPNTRRKNMDSARDRHAEQAKGNVMFVSNKSPRKTQSQIPEPNKTTQSHEKYQADNTRGRRIYYRNGRRIVLKEIDDTGVMDPLTQSSNIEISRDENVQNKEFDCSTTMPSTEMEMWFHNESKKFPEQSKKTPRHQIKAQPEVSRKMSNHVLSAATKTCESNKKTLYSMKGDPKLWGINKQRIAQNVRAVLSSADFEKVWKRIETTKSKTGVISSEDQRWIVNQLLLGGKKSIQKSNSELPGGEPKQVNDNMYKINYDKPRKSSGVAIDVSDKPFKKLNRTNPDKTVQEVTADYKQKEVTRSPTDSTDYFIDGGKNGTSSQHSNHTAIVLTGQKLYLNSKALEISDKNEKEEKSSEIISDFGVKDSRRLHSTTLMKNKNDIMCAVETEAATKSDNALDDDTLDQTNTFPRRKNQRHSLFNEKEETVCVRSESQKYARSMEHSRSTALSCFIADINPWVGHSRKAKHKLSTHLQKTISSLFSQPSQSGSVSTSNAKLQENNTEEAPETFSVDKSKVRPTEDTSSLKEDESDAVNSGPKPDLPYRSPKSMTAVGNAANLYTQAWRKKSSVLEINLGTIDEEMVFPKIVSPAQMPDKISADNLLKSLASKTVLSTTAPDALNPSTKRRELNRERTNATALSLLEDCLLRSASSAKCPNDATARQSAKIAVKSPISNICKLKASHDNLQKTNKEADQSCDSMWKFDDSPSTADIVISWLAQTNDTELSIARITDQDFSNEHLTSPTKHQVESEDEPCNVTAKDENRKQKLITGIPSRKGGKAVKNNLEELKTDASGELTKSRKRVRAPEKEDLKKINDVGPAWWLKREESEAANAINTHKKPAKTLGREESTKTPVQKTGGTTAKSNMRGHSLVNDRYTWPHVPESKITAWKRATRKRVEPISDQPSASQDVNESFVLNDDVDKAECKSTTRFNQTNSLHKLTSNKSLSKIGARDPRGKDDMLALSDCKIRYTGCHPVRPTQSTRHGIGKHSASLQFLSKSDSSTGNNHVPPGKDPNERRHAARNVTENNNLKMFRLKLAKVRSPSNEPEFCNSLFLESNKIIADSGPRPSMFVGWKSTETPSVSTFDTALRGVPHDVQSSYLGTHHTCSNSEVSTFNGVIFDWYKPLTAPLSSINQTEEVNISDQTDSHFLHSFKSDSNEESSFQSQVSCSSIISGTFSSTDGTPTRDNSSEMNENWLVKTDKTDGGKMKRGVCNEDVDLIGRCEGPGTALDGGGASSFEPLLYRGNATPNRNMVCSSNIYSEFPPKPVCCFKKLIKQQYKGNFLSVGDDLKFEYKMKIYQEKEGEQEALACDLESPETPSEITRQASVRSNAKKCVEDRVQCRRLWHGGIRDCENGPEDRNVLPRDHWHSLGQAGSDVISGDSLETPMRLHLRTADTEPYSIQDFFSELPTPACTSQLTFEHPSHQPSGADIMISSHETLIIKPLHGFSYLYNNDTATSDSPAGFRSSPCPVLLRVRPPKSNTMVGQLVKMFEKRLKFRQQPDITY